MPSITDKLRDLGVQVGTSNIKPSKKPARPASLTDTLQGSWEKTSAGDCFVVRKHIPFSDQNNAKDLPLLPQVGVFEFLSAFAGISEIPFDKYIFIDTETTGLSGGAGTYVFLTGAAKFENDGIHFAQFFLQDPENEPCQLAALEEFSANARVVVSYNGKSFDLPRIKNRYLFHGWPAPFQNIYHLDLLHIVRRLWKTQLPTCSLGDVEYHLLDIQRASHDIPGWQVSEKFFEYLQNGDSDPLKGVFYHNEVDVISLVTLLSYITDRLSNPLSDSYRNRLDLIPIGRYLADLSRTDLSIEVLSSALQNKSLPIDLTVLGLKSLATIHKRGKDQELAIPLWEKCASLDDVHSKIELAMYYEHKISDFQEAIHWTLSAQASVKQSPELKSQYKDELEHRLNRLKNKEKIHRQKLG
ncbi:MAG TPA: hypothetical protein ENF22_01180 [Chloroflexi bacterium]|nr:hypothetical protein [Chloroflexota bacterium]